MSNCKKRVWKSSPQAAETLEHDLDGNLTMDGVRVPDGQGGYSLDTERVMTWNYDSHLASAWPKWPATGDKLWQYEYDYQGRRVRKYSAAWDQSTNGGYGAYVPPVLVDIRYVYDGWNVILELDGRDLTGGAGGGPDGSPDNVVLRKYAWGLDLSGTMQGAGGIGGLLGVHDVDSTDDFLAYRDANGNVGQLVAADGSVAARYEYDAYGDNQLDPTSIVESGPYALTNPFRFSSKYFDAASDLSYYGRRYFYQCKGRWTSRDPSEESAGLHLYCFVANSPIGNVDFLGLARLRLEFNAFIPGSLGTWIDEPWSSTYTWPTHPRPQFRTDLREFGGGTSRVWSRGWFETTKIGQLGPGDYDVDGNSDPSHRRTWSASGWTYHQAVAAKKGEEWVANINNCKSIVYFRGEAAYPFVPTAPDIDYDVAFLLENVGGGSIEVSIYGFHNLFPNYEALIDHALFYTYRTPYDGPGLYNLNRTTYIPTLRRRI